jgi:hypothetical protein
MCCVIAIGMLSDTNETPMVTENGSPDPTALPTASGFFYVHAAGRTPLGMKVSHATGKGKH